ncbi:MAG: hypothetical protein HZB25_09030 [Candidatus Eisenbacteria bacterium]|nr:hypothetical protein [Candidatus Eisenbacteria bacterium]
MKTARILLRMVRADFLERVRRHAFLVTLALAAWLGYSVNAGQFMLRLDHYRGEYNSAWIGGLMATVVTTMLSLAGFYVVRNSVERDRITGVGQILAATPMRRPLYTLAKMLSNFLTLASMVAVLALAALAMQGIRGESAHVDWWPLLNPFLLIALPAMAVTAALAVFFECAPGLSGSAGNAIYAGLWATSISVALFTGWDMQGIRLLYSSMGAACRAAYPSYQGGFLIGYSGAVPVQTFVWEGVRWTGALMLERLMWVGVALGVALLAAVFFDRFDPAARRGGRRGPAAGGGEPAEGVPEAGPGALMDVVAPARLTPLGPAPSRGRLFALLRAELTLLYRSQPKWWRLVALGLLVAGFAMPPDISRRSILVAAWIWPLAAWSSMGAREVRHGVSGMIFSGPHPLLRQLPATWLAGFLLALAAGAGVGVRLAMAGDAAGVGAFLAGAAFVPSLALALGAWSNTPRAFEAVYTLLWYFGPLNQVPPLDYMGAWKESVALGAPWFYLAAVPVLVALATAGRSRRMRTA